MSYPIQVTDCKVTGRPILQEATYWVCDHCGARYDVSQKPLHSRSSPRWEGPLEEYRAAYNIWYTAYRGPKEQLSRESKEQLSRETIQLLARLESLGSRWVDVDWSTHYCSDACVEPYDLKAVRLALAKERSV